MKTKISHKEWCFLQYEMFKLRMQYNLQMAIATEDPKQKREFLYVAERFLGFAQESFDNFEIDDENYRKIYQDDE